MPATPITVELQALDSSGRTIVAHIDPEAAPGYLGWVEGEGHVALYSYTGAAMIDAAGRWRPEVKALVRRARRARHVTPEHGLRIRVDVWAPHARVWGDDATIPPTDTVEVYGWRAALRAAHALRSEHACDRCGERARCVRPIVAVVDARLADRLADLDHGPVTADGWAS